MKLITFVDNAGSQRLGALDHRDRVVDLHAGWGAIHGKRPAPHLASMLALIGAGDGALDDTRRALDEILRVEPEGVIRSRADTQLLAPVPIPAQIRDGLCFEKHLTQVYAAIGRMKAMRPSGRKEIDDIVNTGVTPPQVWYRQPIYYKGNRFSVVEEWSRGSSSEIHWRLGI